MLCAQLSKRSLSLSPIAKINEKCRQTTESISVHRTTEHERYYDLQEERRLFQSGFIFRWKLFERYSKYSEYWLLRNMKCVHSSKGCYLTRMIPSYSTYQPPMHFITIILGFLQTKVTLWVLTTLSTGKPILFYKHAVEFTVSMPKFFWWWHQS